MSFKTDADIQSGYYGRWKYDKKNKLSTFTPLGKAVYLGRVTVNIEDHEAQLELYSSYMGEPKSILVPRIEMADNTLTQSLIKIGLDVPKKHFDVIVDTIRLQEAEMEANGVSADKVYSHLGWIRLPIYDETGTPIGSKLHYRANRLLGGVVAKYTGPYSIVPMGSFAEWRDMVNTEVIGNTALEVVLIAGLSAVVNGLIGPITTGENPIVHLCSGSRAGKTTALQLATSAYGEPFDGERRAIDKSGKIKKRRSIYGSWSATENATITQCAGNKGAVIVLNELGKFKGRDMGRIVYDLSEGTDKTRLDSRMETYGSENYATTILSAGEISLLGRCADKLEGLQIRVMELDMPLTKSAEQSRHIKDICRKHNGWAAPILAQYIIDNGGVDLVHPIYKRLCEELRDQLPDAPAKERFIEKFAALFLTTAELATKALGIQFDKEGIIHFLAEHEASYGEDRNTAKSSYDAIIEACAIHKRCFFINDEPTPAGNGKIFGRINKCSEELSDGRVVVAEYLVRRKFVEEVLEKQGFPNIKTCIKEWRAIGVLDAEDDTHPTRARKVDPDDKAERVFVFRVFGDPSVVSDPPKVKLKSTLVEKAKGGTAPSKPLSPQLSALLNENEEEDNSND